MPPPITTKGASARIMVSTEAGLPTKQVDAMIKRETDRYIQANPIS
jgi:hypothetical protein